MSTVAATDLAPAPERVYRSYQAFCAGLGADVRPAAREESGRADIADAIEACPGEAALLSLAGISLRRVDPGIHPGMTRPGYAIGSWPFADSTFPMAQNPSAMRTPSTLAAQA